MVKQKQTVCPRTDSPQTERQKHGTSSFHTDSRHLQCEICSKTLSSKQNLKEHLNIHSGNKPYACPYPNCQGTFRQTSQLSNHKKMHRVLIEKMQRSEDDPEAVAVSQMPGYIIKGNPKNQADLPFLKMPPLNFKSLMGKSQDSSN